MRHLINDIYSSGLKLLVPSTLQETYETIVDEAVELVGAKWGSLYLGINDELHLKHATSPKNLQVQPRRRGFTYTSYISGKVVVVSKEEVEKVHPHDDNTDLQSFIMIPLFYDGQPTGVLNLQSTLPTTSITPNHIKGLQLFGAMASLAIRKTMAQYEMQQSLEKRDLFISMAAHEFRTPLTVIKLYVQMLHKKYDSLKVPEKRWSESLLKETNRLINLVNELLHVDQVRTGRLKYAQEECHLRSIIQDAIFDSQTNYSSHTFFFKDKLPNGEDTVIGDNNKLMQVFINLLNNAAKFSPPDSMVTVTLEEDTDKYKAVIKDQGPGIPKREMNRIFEAFYKGEKNLTKEGMGLGLSLVKRIVERSKGTVDINSKTNKGTTVTVSLPKAENGRRTYGS